MSISPSLVGSYSSTDFFASNEFGRQIFNARYAQDGETWEQSCRRQADAVGYWDSQKQRDEYYQLLVQGKAAAGGRIAYSAGREKAGYLNCYVVPISDSREGWGKHLSDTVIISGTGGGIGTNFSSVRPRGAEIKGTGGVASGAVSVMRMANSVGEEIRSGGGRRAAYMFCLNHNHPDILEFLDAKLESSRLPRHLIDKLLAAGVDYKDLPADLLRGELNCANISILFMDEDPSDFFDRVQADGDHHLVFNGKVIRTIKARDLWQRITRNALKNGEPGVLNGYLANEMNNIAYCRKLVSVNPCAEQWLQPYGVCCLGSLVLPRFVNELKLIDWAGLKKAVHIMVRFLDNVLDVTPYPIPEVEKESHDVRRIGLGYMGLHDTLLLLGYKYSTPEGRQVAGQIAEYIKVEAYLASIHLAKEKGSFKLLDREKFVASPFIQAMPNIVQDAIRTFGIRNCALLTIAPTGTTSIVQGVSSGLEPMFAPVYERNWQTSEGIKSEVLTHPLFEKFVREGRDVSHFEASEELSPEDHLLMQIVLQEHIDSSISKTINIPQAEYTEEMVSDLYMKYFPYVKGLTVYPVGSREATPLRALPLQVGIDMIKAGESNTAVVDNDCISGTCSI